MTDTKTTALTVKIESIPEASRWDPLSSRWRWEVRGPWLGSTRYMDEQLSVGSASTKASARRQARRAARRIWRQRQAPRHTETFTYTGEETKP